MVPEYGPVHSLKGSEVWALGFYRVDAGRVRGPLV